MNSSGISTLVIQCVGGVLFGVNLHCIYTWSLAVSWGHYYYTQLFIPCWMQSAFSLMVTAENRPLSFGAQRSPFCACLSCSQAWHNTHLSLPAKLWCWPAPRCITANHALIIPVVLQQSLVWADPVLLEDSCSRVFTGSRPFFFFFF